MEQNESEPLDREGQHILIEDLEAEAYMLDDDFNVTSIEQANQVADKIAALEEKLEREKEGHRLRANRLERSIAYLTARFEGQLQLIAFQEIQRYAGKKNAPKSFILPCGVRLGFQSSSRNYRVVDEEEFRAWAAYHVPGSIKHVPERFEIAREPIKDYIADPDNAGIVPEGCEIDEPVEKFYVRRVKPKKKGSDE